MLATIVRAILRGIEILLGLWYNARQDSRRIEQLEQQHKSDRDELRRRDEEDAEKIVASDDAGAALDYLRGAAEDSNLN